jgi:2,5-diamino-6-(ribosylamino)-4(3H)-pyrimidinone 5'-phosphate reductase
MTEEPRNSAREALRHKRDLIANDKFINTLAELKERKVIVEGKKDVLALERLGFQNPNIIPLNYHSPIDLVHNLSIIGVREVVILTDFDKAGNRLASKLRTLFEAFGIRINWRLRTIMKSFGKTRIEDFGRICSPGSRLGNPTFTERGDSYGKIGSDINKIRDKGGDKGERRY